MSDFTKTADYPVEGGVEVRTMGQSLRPVRIYFEVKEPDPKAESAAHGDNRYQRTATGRMFMVDVETNTSELIPKLGRIHFDPKAVPGMIAGRLERETTDQIVTSHVNPFKSGYMRVYRPGVTERIVSEPFMAFGIVTLGEEEFGNQRDKAETAFAKANPEATRGGWDR